MKPIRLTPGQKRCARIEHPLLDNCKKLTEEELASLVSRWGDGDKSSRDTLIMGQMFLIKNIVGRFLAHWPESKRFEEDMVSEGLSTVIEVIDNFDFRPDFEKPFQKKIWGSVTRKIEKMLNDSRSCFGASIQTNRDLDNEGEETEYCYAQQIREDLDLGYDDTSPAWVDALDELENFREEDREHWRAVIIRCMETEHGIDETELTKEELEAIEHVSKIAGEL